MKILVCVKSVPDLESKFEAAESGAGYKEDRPVFRANAYDEYALEEAARLCEESPDVEFTALTVGASRATVAAKRGIEFGAKYAAHLITESKYLDAFATAKPIADFAKDKDFDLLFFGVMSEDEARSAVAPMVAALLNIPCATSVANLRIDREKNIATAERELEKGLREIVELPLPAAIAFQSGLNKPRYPNLTNKLRARSQALTVIEVAKTQSKSAREKVYTPPPTASGIFIEGEIGEQAMQLIKIVRDKTGLL